ncbi:MAG: 3-phosphoshikimate 1-carboxyvinyltransferase [Acidimicrobiales bacterium]
MRTLPDPLPIEPLRAPPDTSVTVPGSKSITNRALVCAALAGGDSELSGALFADDTRVMIESLRRLGFDLTADEGGAALAVHGSGGAVRATSANLDAGLSGTTARFVAPLAALGSGRYRIDGAPPLRARPVADLVTALRSLGATVTEEGDPGRLPLVVSGPLRGGRARLAGDVTSQFVSALLLAGPAMTGGLRVELTTPLVSQPYVAMTAAVMAAFGASVDGLSVPSGRYHGRRYAIEPDASAASYFLAAAAICGGRVRIEGLGHRSLQGDARFVDLLERMGAAVERADSALTVTGTGVVHGIEADLRDMPDMAQTLAVVAVFADAPTRVSGVGFIRGHETDRIAAVVAELRRCGIDARDEPDGFVVQPGQPRAAVIQTYDDHRMAMSFALLGLRVPGIAISDPGCVAKTFPGYWDALAGLRRG